MFRMFLTVQCNLMVTALRIQCCSGAGRLSHVFHESKFMFQCPDSSGCGILLASPWSRDVLRQGSSYLTLVIVLDVNNRTVPTRSIGGI